MQVPGLTDVSVLGVGLASKADGTVWVWEAGGQPEQFIELADLVSIELGSRHQIVIRSDGTAWAWGDNDWGQLGDGGITDRATPVKVDGLQAVVGVAVGLGFSLAVTSDGTVWSWGDNYCGQLATGTRYAPYRTPVQVHRLDGVVGAWAGGWTSFVLKADGTLWSCGSNRYGQLGDGTTNSSGVPVQVRGSGGMGFLSDVVSIAASGSSSLALKTDGTVWGWGLNTYGQLGNGTTSGSDPNPTPVQAIGVTDAVAVSAGGHALGLKGDGKLLSWGLNSYGQLGDGTQTDKSIPEEVPGLSGVVDVSAGALHSVALKEDGTVWAWGRNNHGQLGDGTETNRTTAVQVKGVDGEGFLTGVVAISAGRYHNVAIIADGTLRSWGGNYDAQLGDGTLSDRRTPIKVHGVGDVGFLEDVAEISVFGHNLAMGTDGTIWGWGPNGGGQLGDGTMTLYRTTPVVLSSLSGVTGVAAGSYHSLFFGPGLADEAAPMVLVTWPVDGDYEGVAPYIVVRFSEPVTNVSPDDLMLSVGEAVSVTGDGEGPYIFTLAGMEPGPIAALVWGDITDLSGNALEPYLWAFEQTSVREDLDFDGDVDLDDLGVLLAAMSGPDEATNNVVADLDGDGDCDIGDFSIFSMVLADMP